MPNILERYGIKEVADVTFYNIDKDTGNPTNPVLYLDTLKVSTIEQTSENVSARGGKGNAELITWDYGKEITVTLEDALYSAKSMAVQFGGSTFEADDVSFKDDVASVMKTVWKENVLVNNVAPDASEAGTSTVTATVDGKKFELTACTFYDGKGTVVTTGKEYAYVTGKVIVQGSQIDVSANSFPGTYYVTGDTYARSETSGQDEYFQFIMPKAKMLAESNTITLEAEGDPTVFSMNLKILRPKDGVMMKLVQYTLPTTTETT